MPRIPKTTSAAAERLIYYRQHRGKIGGHGMKHIQVWLPYYIISKMRKLSILEQRSFSQTVSYVLMRACHGKTVIQMQRELHSLAEFLQKENMKAMKRYDETGKPWSKIDR